MEHSSKLGRRVKIHLLHSFSGLATAGVLLSASLAVPATAHADCGQDGQPACTGPVPTPDQVAAIMNELTDPNIPAVNGTVDLSVFSA
jgi:hypothetical protein